MISLSRLKEMAEEEMENKIKELEEKLSRKEQECEELKKYKDVVDKLAGMQVILTNEEKMPMLYENAKDLKLKQLSKTLTEIKEIAEECIKTNDSTYNPSIQVTARAILSEEILNKISECEGNDEQL